MTDTKTLAYGYAWDNQARDWTKRIEYLASDLHEAKRWLEFNKDWLLNRGIEAQHDAHVFTWLIEAFD
jgi:hypothetical protein